ncbi:bifunctional oligoribonuclease/PAP phosphatase NrnA [Shimazuella sp. AN120528]|uniref:DHH family phosphoesterase n=1 Tax=Shimazuella soli TaxID=1892854 RepID=UPI001F0EC8E8|nr:bifunctional oligoribonuclease/PAP phosphatase NrnA [Shimazuella soli]MCH5586255.1 bifunctional oligoribonuclease/PAP phosphatase NrnA [Shimazuella soli]
MLDWTSATQTLKNTSQILVVSHVNPDGDAIGSTLAMGLIAKSLGISVTLVNESPVPEKLEFLPGTELIQLPSQVKKRFSVIVTVDAADISRIGECQQLFADDPIIINIDHHATNDGFGTINVVKAEAAATVEILYDWAEYLDIPISKQLATVLYAGLLTDTGGFRYSNTSPNVLRIAATLLESGAASYELADRLLESISVRYLEQLKEALGTMQIVFDGKVAYLTSEEEDNDGLVNLARNIEGVDVGILFRPMDEHHIKVSMRSRNIIDVSQVALSLGGGGHARAAGCTVKGTMNEVIHNVLEKMKEAFEGVNE